LYWLHTDETNADRKQGRFFIYGGLVATADQMANAHEMVCDIRGRYGFRPSDSLKFHTRSRPADVSHEDWTSAKSDAISGAANLGMKMIVTVVHHDIAAKKSDETRAVWALENLAHHFGHRFLSKHGSFGAICIDRLPESYSYPQLERMFRSELEINGSPREIPGVIHYSVTTEGASHINSLVDICLGSFRFCANAVFEDSERKETIACEMFPTLSQLIWADETGPDGTTRFVGNGIKYFPVDLQKIYSNRIRSDYVLLLKELARYRRGSTPPRPA
jgi:hypothetical protein